VIYDVGRVLKRLQEHIDSRRTAKAGNFQRAFGYVMGSRLVIALKEIAIGKFPTFILSQRPYSEQSCVLKNCYGVHYPSNEVSCGLFI
jgi:hypothetical protein